MPLYCGHDADRPQFPAGAHPYGIARLIKQWGKDQVVNVGQRTALYRTIERLEEAGLVAVRGTGRDQQYPERTVYEITGAGQAVTRQWLEEMLAEPRREYPEFPVALSHLMMLTPAEALDLLERREQALTAQHAGLAAGLAAAADLPRVLILESEYAAATSAAQLAWLRAVIADLRAGRLAWSEQELLATARGDAQAAQAGQQPKPAGKPARATPGNHVARNALSSSEHPRTVPVVGQRLSQRRGHRSARRRLSVRVGRLPWAAALILEDPQVGSASGVTGLPVPGTFIVPPAGRSGMLPRPLCPAFGGGVCGSTRPAPAGRSPYRPAEAGTRPPARRRRFCAVANRP
jgi:DNA-binding PadR family transcriptional regulator